MPSFFARTSALSASRLSLKGPICTRVSRCASIPAPRNCFCKACAFAGDLNTPTWTRYALPGVEAIFSAGEPSAAACGNGEELVARDGGTSVSLLTIFGGRGGGIGCSGLAARGLGPAAGGGNNGSDGSWGGGSAAGRGRKPTHSARPPRASPKSTHA